MTKTVTIDWTLSHDVTDKSEWIMSTLEAGYDEGPLIVVEAIARPPGRRPGRATAWIFQDCSWYLAHLAYHADDLSGERWVGIVRGTARANGPTALSALRYVQAAIAPPQRRPLTLSRRPQPSIPNYSVVESFEPLSEPISIEHVGEGKSDVIFALPHVGLLTEISPESSE